MGRRLVVGLIAIIIANYHQLETQKSATCRGFGGVELGGFEPPTSWVRSGSCVREKCVICRIYWSVVGAGRSGGYLRIPVDYRAFGHSSASSAENRAWLGAATSRLRSSSA